MEASTPKFPPTYKTFFCCWLHLILNVPSFPPVPSCWCWLLPIARTQCTVNIQDYRATGFTFTCLTRHFHTNVIFQPPLNLLFIFLHLFLSLYIVTRIGPAIASWRLGIQPLCTKHFNWWINLKIRSKVSTTPVSPSRMDLSLKSSFWWSNNGVSLAGIIKLMQLFVNRKLSSGVSQGGE